jgi:tellurite methyltransferase
VERAITGFHEDEDGDWVAELSCGHNQHVRHRPPFQERTWVLDRTGRAERLGAPIDCPPCDRAELPEGLRTVRSGPLWDERTMPRGLLRTHQLAAGTWGQILVHDGRLRFAASTVPPIEVALGPRSAQAIPPEVEHAVRPLGSVRFSIDVLAMDDRDRPRSTPPAEVISTRRQDATDEGGETACWAGLLCRECGVVLDGGPHRPGCARPRHD